MPFAAAWLFLTEPLSQRCVPHVSCTWSSRSRTIVSTVCTAVCTMDSTTPSSGLENHEGVSTFWY